MQTMIVLFTYTRQAALVIACLVLPLLVTREMLSTTPNFHTTRFSKVSRIFIIVLLVGFALAVLLHIVAVLDLSIL